MTRGAEASLSKTAHYQARPYSPEPRAQRKVSHHRLWRGPSAANKIACSSPALVHAHANKEHQKPFKGHNRQVTMLGQMEMPGDGGLLLRDWSARAICAAMRGDFRLPQI
jgi:hypothetical protein